MPEIAASPALKLVNTLFPFINARSNLSAGSFVITGGRPKLNSLILDDLFFYRQPKSKCRPVSYLTADNQPAFQGFT